MRPEMKKITFFIILMHVIFAPSLARAAEWKPLHTGSSGHEVYALKLLLLHRGYNPGKINTVFDQKTAGALISFQKSSGLNPNGTTEPDTWNKLIRTVGVSEQPKDKNAVRAIQYLLNNKYSFSSLDTDGNYGLETKAAVLLFQKNYETGAGGVNGMDGIAGAETWSCLIRDSKKVNDYKWVICIDFNCDRGLLGTLYTYDASGANVLEIPCLGQSITMNPDWRQQYANTPLGCFRAAVSRRQRSPSEFGKYRCIELNDEDVKAVTNGRDGILIHSGSNKYKHKPDYTLPAGYKGLFAQTIQGLDQTHGCVRISGEDHARLYNTLKGTDIGIVSISER